MTPTPTSPPAPALTSALTDLRAKNPTLGIPKIHALLLATHPQWTVSEKRTRKVLQAAGLVIGTQAGTGTQAGSMKSATEAEVYPSSRLIRELDVRKWTSKVAVRYFDTRKGKGLVATERIRKGEVVWKEDPFVIAPEWPIYDMQQSATACAFCTTPLTPSPLILPCPATSTPTTPSPSPCPAHFCNRLCLSRSAAHHPLLCPVQNPASVPLLAYARKMEWMALHALAQCTSRVLLARGAALARDWAVVRGFAELGLEERWRSSFDRNGAPEPDRTTWVKAHELFVQAFHEPTTPLEKKKLARVLCKGSGSATPLPPDVETELFGYEAFLRGLGRMSLNLEAHGGLYTLHSHLNHSCAPNLSVRHLDRGTALARLTVVARSDVGAGEELVIAYVDPGMGVKARRGELRAWGFGVCKCVRCVEEGGDGDEGEEEEGDLERELKAGLGVM